MQRKNYNPTFWGPKAWFFIDSIILSLPDNVILESELQTSIKNFFLSLQLLLPCEKCRIHYTEYYRNNYLDCSKKQNILIWINNLHNIISTRNNKKTYSINDMYKYYDMNTSNFQYNSKSNNYFNSFYNISILILFIIIILFVIKQLHSKY